MGEIEQIADTVAVLRKGKLIEEVSMDFIRKQQTNYIEIKTPHLTKAKNILKEQLNLRTIELNDETKAIKIFDKSVPSQKILKTMIDHDVEIDTFQKIHPSLEDYFLERIHGSDQNV